MTLEEIAVTDRVINPAWPERVMEVERILQREGIAQCTYPEAGKVRHAYHALAVLSKVE